METFALPTLTALVCTLALANPAAQAAGAAATQVKPSDQSKGEIRAQREFKLLDINGDGKLSRGEVRLFPRLEPAFDRADTDRDGFVSYGEVRAFAIIYRAERALQRPAQTPQPTKESAH